MAGSIGPLRRSAQVCVLVRETPITARRRTTGARTAPVHRVRAKESPDRLAAFVNRNLAEAGPAWQVIRDRSRPPCSSFAPQRGPTQPIESKLIRRSCRRGRPGGTGPFEPRWFPPTFPQVGRSRMPTATTSLRRLEPGPRVELATT